MMDTPERIWVQWPNVGGCGLAFKTPANPRHKSDDRFNKRTAYILATPEALADSPEVQALILEAEARGMERAAARARVYASNYEQSSDGRNTFILLAEWADTEAAAIRETKP